MTGERMLVDSAEAKHVDHVVDALGSACTRAFGEPNADWLLPIESAAPDTTEDLRSNDPVQGEDGPAARDRQ